MVFLLLHVRTCRNNLQKTIRFILSGDLIKVSYYILFINYLFPENIYMYTKFTDVAQLRRLSI